MKQKCLTETPVCPHECLVIISNTTSLSFALKRIGPLAAIITIVFYLLILYLFALSNTPENPFASIYNESLIKTACQHLLLLVGFNTLIYQKYYDAPPILVGHHSPPLAWGKPLIWLIGSDISGIMVSFPPWRHCLGCSLSPQNGKTESRLAAAPSMGLWGAMDIVGSTS
jgi:hypothetical protein